MLSVKAHWRVTLSNNTYKVTYPGVLGGTGSTLTNATITANSGINGTWSTTAATNWTSTNHKSVLTIPAGEEKVVLEKHAALEVKGKVIINGLDLEERLKTIEYVLGLPERDVTIEAKYPSLKKKYDEYVKELGKYRTFEALKGDNNGTT